MILDQAGFEKTYSDHVDNKLIGGTGVYGVFWDGTACNGLGDIDIRETDVLNLFWEPGKEDIQESRDLFHTELMDNDVLLEQHPQLAGKLGGTGAFATAKYAYDDAGGHQRQVCGGGLVLQAPCRRAHGAALLQIRRGHGAVCHGRTTRSMRSGACMTMGSTLSYSTR